MGGMLSVAWQFDGDNLAVHAQELAELAGCAWGPTFLPLTKNNPQPNAALPEVWADRRRLSRARNRQFQSAVADLSSGYC